MPLLVPDAVLNNVPSVLLSHKYVYVPFPPVGVDPVKATGIAPVHIDCTALTVFDEMEGLTVIVAVPTVKPDVRTHPLTSVMDTNV